MDEPWRAVSVVGAARRRRPADHLRRIPVDSPLDPNDFHDVFGGPPRTVLLRRFSGDQFIHRRRSLYDDVFRKTLVSGVGTGRSLPGFHIQVRDVWVKTEEGFYDDIFGSNSGDRRSRSRSKSKLRSSSSDRSTAAAATADSSLVTLASKLRPITIPPRRRDCSAPSTICTEEPNNNQRSSSRRFEATPGGSMDLDFNSSSGFTNRQRSHTAFLCCFLPPKTASYHCHDRSSGQIFDSPSSVIPSLFLDPVAKLNTMYCDTWQRDENESENGRNLVESEGVEVTDNSFLIEINGNGVQDVNEDDAALDEAIAWARESFWNQKPAESATTEERRD